MFRFAEPYYLYFLSIIPVFIVLAIYASYRKKRNIESIGDLSVINQLMPDVSSSRPVLKIVLILIGFTFLVLAVSRPQFGSKLQEVKREGVEIMIALDVSNSMNAQDIQPSRIERAKQAISKLVDKLHNDKIGLIVFAGAAYTQIPITTDYVSAKMFLNYVSTDIVPIQGTAIGLAIDKAVTSFPEESQLQKAIVVITDGENHEDNPIEAAQLAREKGIVVHTLGMGLPQGTPIPVSPDNPTNFRKDRQGSVVISKLDETTLQQIAVAGGGMYVRANNTQVGLNKLFDQIDKMNKKEYDAVTYSDYEEQYQVFLFISVLFMIIGLALDSKKSKKLRKFKLFTFNN